MWLKIVQAGEPVLREKAKDLSKEEILSSPIQDLIANMQETLRQIQGVGLAAPQVGVSVRLAIIEDRAEYHKLWRSDQLSARQRKEVPCQVIINPKITKREGEASFFEGCLSVPVMGIVKRALTVTVECLNEKGEPQIIHATGWYARILQHEIDHLDGILNIDKTDIKTVTTMENFNRFWKDKS